MSEKSRKALKSVLQVTSATRAVRADVLSGLFAVADTWLNMTELPYGASFFLALDVAARERGVPVHTCVLPPAEEDPCALRRRRRE